MKRSCESGPCLDISGDRAGRFKIEGPTSSPGTSAVVDAIDNCSRVRRLGGVCLQHTSTPAHQHINTSAQFCRTGVASTTSHGTWTVDKPDRALPARAKHVLELTKHDGPIGSGPCMMPLHVPRPTPAHVQRSRGSSLAFQCPSMFGCTIIRGRVPEYSSNKLADLVLLGRIMSHAWPKQANMLSGII